MRGADDTPSYIVTPNALRGAIAACIALGMLLALPSASFAFAPTAPESAPAEPGIEEVQTYSPYVMAYERLDVEDRQGYNSGYIFGMTKGVARSTLVPALKPVVALFTIPLDLAFLPFAAIMGFF